MYLISIISPRSFIFLINNMTGRLEIFHLSCLLFPGDKDAVRDSVGIFRLLGTVARDQYLVSFRARFRVFDRRQHGDQPGTIACLRVELLQSDHVLLHEQKVSSSVPWPLRLSPLLEVNVLLQSALPYDR